VIKLPEFHAVTGFHELLGSRCRADVIRILEFDCSNELAKMASKVGSVFRHDALLYCGVLCQASESAPSSVLFFDHRLFLQM
jgi:hypothetical protein